MRRMLMVLAIFFGMAFSPFALQGVSAQGPGSAPGEAACNGANGGLDTAFANALPTAGANAGVAQVAFVVATVTGSNPEVPVSALQPDGTVFPGCP